MDETEMKKIIAEIESQLNGDPEHDADIWMEWGDRYRENPDAEPLVREIIRRLISLAIGEDGDLPQEIFDDMIETMDEDYAEACSLIELHRLDEALGKLLVMTALIRVYQLPDEKTVWMDFASYLDALNYQDLFADYIGDREIGRHPLHPARILFTTGSLLIDMDRAEEALVPLQMLRTYDPVCPRYLFELGDAYKRTGQIQEAAEIALWTLSCASTRAELARGYRDLAYCLSEMEAYEDAVILYLMSLGYESSRQAQSELAWINKKAGISAEDYDDAAIRRRCAELNIPTEISETVTNNIEFLKMIGEADRN